MSNIEIKNLNFGYDDRLIFNQAHINIDDNWKLGLVGRNGRGKSTLLNILRGKLEIESPIKGNKQFVYFPQEIEIKEENQEQLALFALQELADFEQWELERELSLMKVNLDILWLPFKNLSGGEQTKLLLALLFLDQTNFALIDEPTNHLDKQSRDLVAGYLKKKSGFILVSHDRDFLDETVDHILAIERQDIKLYQGDFSIYESEKKRRDEFEQLENEKLEREIGRLKQTAREKSEWSKNRETDKLGNPNKKGSGGIFDTGGIGARAARVMKKAKNLEKRMNNDISDKEKLLKNLEKVTDLEMNYRPDHHKILAQFEDFTLAYTHDLFCPVSFELEQGEITGLVGQNGSGKSSFVRFLQGNLQMKSTGKWSILDQIKISYVRQIYDNRGFLKEFAQTHQLDIEIFLNSLRKLGMEREVFNQKIENMSQGQQKKVELARSLSEEAQLYIWDEPLNYLDVFNQEQIIELLKKVKPTMLLIEHDSFFIKEVCSQIVELKLQNMSYE